MEQFVSGQNEEILEAVYELGRTAIKEGVGELEVLRLYHEAILKINGKENGVQVLALDFLNEFLAPYELRQRGYKDLINQLNEQNIELRKEVEKREKSEEELKRSKEYFQHLIENALDIIMVLKPDCTIHYGSPSIEGILGNSPLAMRGKSLCEYIHPNDVQKVYNILHSIEEGKIQTIEFKIKHDDGSWRYLESNIKRTKGLNEEPVIIINSRDVSERVKVHNNLRQSQQKLAGAQKIAKLGSWEWIVEENSLQWSDEMCAIYGLTQEESPKSFEEYLNLLPSENRDKLGTIIKKNYEDKTPFNFEQKIVRADGKNCVIYTRGKVVTDETDKAVKLIGTCQDITLMKEVEEQLREYSERLKSYMAKEEKTREEERIRIAREIHDELGQMLTVLKLDISLAASDAESEFEAEHDSPFMEEMDTITKRIDTIIKSVQRISKNLRPDIFDHLGFDEAILWQAKEFEERTGIKCSMLNKANCIEQMVDERSIAIYRILQETLTNILRHADATKVDISLKQDNRFFILQIKDNGKGIEQKNLKQSNSLGIIGMRERSKFLNGDISFEGEAGKGTTVTLKIPLNEAEYAKTTSGLTLFKDVISGD
ncbi:MAG: PAS domain S-box protein [Balneolaceae bacterium]